jgi:pimeloyl-ACP methyl ester carboxylesterase
LQGCHEPCRARGRGCRRPAARLLTTPAPAPAPPPTPPAPPLPQRVKSLIERLWWRNLSSPATVESLLSLVYARPVDDELLLARILEATEHPGAIDAFASIVLSPKTRRSFDENIASLRCPVLLCYGAQDPWVVPLWGQVRAAGHAPEGGGQPGAERAALPSIPEGSDSAGWASAHRA